MGDRKELFLELLRVNTLSDYVSRSDEHTTFAIVYDKLHVTMTT